MVGTSEEAEIRILIILLQHPAGLSFTELYNKQRNGGVDNKPTFTRVLKRLKRSLLKQDASGKYTLGIIEPIAQIIKAGEYDSLRQVPDFLEILFKEFSESQDKQAKLYRALAGAFIDLRNNTLDLVTNFLAFYFYDRRIREIWLEGVKRFFDLSYQKRDEMLEKFYNVKASEEFLDENLKNEVWERINKKARHIVELNFVILEFINELPARDETKALLKKYLVMDPILKTLSEEPERIMKFIRDYKEFKESSSLLTDDKEEPGV